MYNEDGEWTTPTIRAGGIGYQSYPADQVSLETGVACTKEEDMTQQSFKEESDINEIVRRFGLTGQMPADFRAPQSGDFTGIYDFQSAMNAVRQAQESFDSLPANIRAKFDNNPQKMMDFLLDEKNVAEARELGLIEREPEKTRDAVQAIDELRATMTTPQQAEQQGK